MVVDTCGNIVDIVTPSGDNRVTLDRVTGHSSCREGLRETLPGLSVGDLLAFAADTGASTNELVGSHATKRERLRINEILEFEKKVVTWNLHKRQPFRCDANRTLRIWDIGYGRSRISRTPLWGRTFRGSSGIRVWRGSSTPEKKVKN